jgi:hypothetical protein
MVELPLSEEAVDAKITKQRAYIDYDIKVVN